MSYDDFCKCTYEEFESISKSWLEMYQGQNRDAWERTRLAVCISIQPHLKKRITPQQLLPLPWDKKKEIPRGEAKKLTAEERRKRFEVLANRS